MCTQLLQSLFKSLTSWRVPGMDAAGEEYTFPNERNTQNKRASSALVKILYRKTGNAFAWMN